MTVKTRDVTRRFVTASPCSQPRTAITPVTPSLGMSRLQKEAIRRICANEDTIAAALDLLGSASLCTGPGTGYDLREGASGLPAVCAYLASEECVLYTLTI